MNKGRRPQDIFITEDIAVSIVRDNISQRNLEAWRKKVKDGGVDALDKDGQGRSKVIRVRKKKEHIDESKMSDKEIIEYYKVKCAYEDSAILAKLIRSTCGKYLGKWGSR